MSDLIFGNKNFLSGIAHANLHACLFPHRDIIWSREQMFQLPYFSGVYASLETATDFFIEFMEKEEGLGLDPTRHQIMVVPVYSLKGESSYRQVDIPVESGRGVITAHTIHFDVRIIYELLAILTVSPITRAPQDDELAVSVVKMGMASRIGCIDDHRLRRIAAGMAATAPVFRKVAQLGHEWTPDLATLISESDISEKEIDTVVFNTVFRILFHEFAHVMFSESADAREAYADTLQQTFDALANNLDHLKEHDREFDHIASSSNIDSGAKPDSSAIVEEIGFAAQSKNIFYELDREEIMCDIFSAQMTTVLFSSIKPITPSDMRLARWTIATLDVLNEQFNGALEYYSKISNVVDAHEHSELVGKESGQYQDDVIDEQDAAHRRRTEIFNARHMVTLKILDRNLIDRISKKLNQNSPDLAFSLFMDKKTDTEWLAFLMRFKTATHRKVTSYVAAMEMSSRGRAISLFYSNGRGKGESAPLADPFALYMFGRTPIVDQ